MSHCCKQFSVKISVYTCYILPGNFIIDTDCRSPMKSHRDPENIDIKDEDARKRRIGESPLVLCVVSVSYGVSHTTMSRMPLQTSSRTS